jgi:hypothetical protein
MKKIILGIVVVMLFASSISAYTIGGAYASLLKCEWGQYGYEWGHIGTYDVNGKIYKIFFGSNYCQY